eukprot:gene954-1075_t
MISGLSRLGDDDLALAPIWFEYGNALLAKEEDSPSDDLLGAAAAEAKRQARNIFPSPQETNEDGSGNEVEEEEEVDDVEGPEVTVPHMGPNGESANSQSAPADDQDGSDMEIAWEALEVHFHPAVSQVTVPAPDTVHLTAPVTENSVTQDTEKAVADAREISDELSETITALELELRNTAVTASSSSWGQGVTTIGFGAAPQASAFPSSTSSSIRTATTISSNLPHDVTPSTLAPPAPATSSVAFPSQTSSSGIQVKKKVKPTVGAASPGKLGLATVSSSAAAVISPVTVTSTSVPSGVTVCGSGANRSSSSSVGAIVEGENNDERVAVDILVGSKRSREVEGQGVDSGDSKRERVIEQ